MKPDPIDQLPRGVKLLHDPLRNKGTAFTEAEREALGLQGLLPPRVNSVAEQELRVLGNIRNKATDLERYLFLIALQDRNETLFYRVVMNHIEEMLPLIYTPTVGRACQEFGHIYRRPRGLYISLHDRGRVARILRNWPHREARVIVVTDGERILGLGDLGSNGMGIPVGKLALYSACGGIDPRHCLPITLDVGTNNEELLNDPLYMGLEQRRARGDVYDELIEEFIQAAQQVFPGVLIQLEDFGNANAFRLLQQYRDQACLFDDDIQGTGAVGVAGLLAAMRITGSRPGQQPILFVGAGQAAIGIAETLVAALVEEGMAPEQARKNCWLFDTRGLVIAGRDAIPPRKQPYAHAGEPAVELQMALEQVRPGILIGCSGQPGLFDEAAIGFMASINTRPIIFALSNPTSKAECSAQDAYRFSDGRAVFASGSPFAPVELGGRTLVPGQGNNAYIFPGLGLGVVASGARRVSDAMFLTAVRTLADRVSDEDLASGRVYPALSRIREVSLAIASEVAAIAWRDGLTEQDRPPDLKAFIQRQLYQPVYPHYA